jgi:chromosome segregation protein
MLSRLKSLELQGYKTFASKSSLEFPGNITAIVGPNGSGKSNIADSIRWVLGEQSYRLLRGRRTEDMIFIGSDNRARAGMASATITFNNDDGWLPIDFSEVSVTRRAYRDGQNEYLLNGQKIRLKDIQELLSQSGLAERTYTLIGQGLVDSALSARPDERRKFFEEAAGIGLYRGRRSEALNRLDQTQRNLERVRDILSELSPRLRSLERQARRFMEYKTIQADLQELLRDWYGYQWNRSQLNLSQTKEVFHEREERLLDAREKYNLLEAQSSSLRSELMNLRSELNNWHSESASFHINREQVSKELAVLDERQRSMNDQNRNINSDIARISEEIKSRQLNITTMTSDYEKLVAECEEASQQFNQAQSELDKRRSERNIVEQSLHEKRRALVKLETKIVEYKARIYELEERVSSFLLSQDKLSQEQTITRRNFVLLKQKYEELDTNFKSGDSDRLDLENELIKLNEDVHLLEDNNKNFQKESNQLQTEFARLKAQIDVLDQAEKSLSGLNRGAKTVLNAAEKGGIQGKYQPLSTLLEVPKKYELAISASLGEFLDAIVLFDKSDPEAVMHLLSQKDDGRAVLLPIAWMRDLELIEKPTAVGVIDRASNLVGCDKEVKKILTTVLGNTIVVEDRAIAKKLANKISPYAKVVTLDGEIIYGNGSVIAGRENRSAAISRPRQKKELTDALSQTQQLINSLDKARKENDELLDHKKEAISNYRKQLMDMDSLIQEKQRKIHQSNLEFEQAKQKNDWVDSQLINLEQQISESKKSVDQTKELLSNTEENAEKSRAEMRSISQELNNITLDEIQSNVMHWKTNAAVSERAANEAKRRIEEYNQLLSQNQQRFRSLTRRLEDLEISLEELDDEKVQLHIKEQDLQLRIEEFQLKIKPAEEKLKLLELDNNKFQDEITIAQQNVTLMERHVAQGQLDYSRNKDSLDNLKRRIEEDFGLVAFEYTSSISGANPLPIDGLVEQLNFVDELEPDLEENINQKRAQLRRIGPINPEADEEFISVKERHEFMTIQVRDLEKADDDLRQVIKELDELMQREFRKTFDAVAIEFKEMFSRLFGGGNAKLYLTDEDNFNNTGIDIEARLPGRREQGLSLLSGGERSLTAVALIFALLKVSPTPFCVLDEVDAALDEANVGRFCELLQELSKQIQFIVITHNRNTVQVADVIYGITMGRDTASQMISLRLDELSDEMVK